MSYVRVPPDSTGKKVYSQSHTVGADSVEAQVIHIGDSVMPEQQLAVDAKGSASVRFAEGQPVLSGFGYLKTANQRALGVYESSSGSYDDLFSITEVNGGTNTYDDVGHGMLLTTIGTIGSKVNRTTNRYHYYLPGSSNLIVMTTACGDTGKVGNARRWGAFDANDGVFFELYDNTFNVVIRSSTTGSVVNTRIPRSTWNGDKLDGSGNSLFTLDLTKINLWWIDYQWLGSGRVRFGVIEKDGTRTVCHTFQNAGQFVVPYMRAGTLPLATENENHGVTGSPSQLRESCLSIYTEGTYEDYTFWRKSDVDAVGVSVTATPIAVANLRSKQTPEGLNHHNSVIAYPETLNVYTDQPIKLSLYQNTIVTGGTWTGLDSALEVNYTGVATDMLSAFKTWFFDPGVHSICISQYFELNDEGIMLNADGTYANWSFVANKLGATNATVTFNLGYKELY